MQLSFIICLHHGERGPLRSSEYVGHSVGCRLVVCGGDTTVFETDSSIVQPLMQSFAGRLANMLMLSMPVTLSTCS